MPGETEARGRSRGVLGDEILGTSFLHAQSITEGEVVRLLSHRGRLQAPKSPLEGLGAPHTHPAFFYSCSSIHSSLSATYVRGLSTRPPARVADLSYPYLPSLLVPAKTHPPSGEPRPPLIGRPKSLTGLCLLLSPGAYTQ